MVATLLKCRCVWVDNPVCFKPLQQHSAIHFAVFHVQLKLSAFLLAVFQKMNLGLSKQFCWLSYEFRLPFQTSSATQLQSCCLLYITVSINWKWGIYGLKILPEKYAPAIARN